MSVVTFFTDKQSERSFQPGLVHNVEAVINFADKGALIADTVRLLKIPAGAVVMAVHVLTVTQGTTSGTMNIGDGTTADLFDAAIALDAAAGTFVGTSGTESTLAATSGKYYAAAGYIIGTIAGANMVAGKYVVSATYKILNKTS